MSRRLTWLWVGLGLTGAALVAAGHTLAGQAVWVVSNAGLVIHSWRIGQQAQTVMFTAYLGLAAWGVWRLI